MRVFRVAVCLGLMMAPAYAQFTPSFRLNETRELTDDEKARNKANEDAARAARATLPDAKPGDPWAAARTVQPAPAPKAKAKTLPKQ